ncbi:integral membrane protein [Neisseria meningitidis]|nr:integral membrane protein [Neisseria meningitidis]
MYYQVGNKCLEQSQAENVYFSLVVPQITQDGKIIKPEYNGTLWETERTDD